MENKRHAKGIALALEGIDGSGKSSIASLLYERLRARGVKVALVATRGAVNGPLVLPPRTPSYAEEALSQLARLLWPADGAEQHHLLGYGYWTGLAGAYFNGLRHALLPELRDSYDVIVVENWCYKFAAKMALKGSDLLELRQALPLDACLDAVFLLDTAPEQVWQRKSRYSFVELGGQDGYLSLGRESFVDYQSRVRSRLLEFAGEGWTRIDNNSAGLEDACSQIEAMLLPHLALLEGRLQRE